MDGLPIVLLHSAIYALLFFVLFKILTFAHRLKEKDKMSTKFTEYKDLTYQL
jgi:isoprenylcysteine carboxyl methyltransferase (ICMT) family protein YpbQ